MKTALTDRAIKAMRPAAKAYDTHDAVVPGLTLNVLPTGLKRFVLLRRFPGAKHPTRRVLGAYGELTLEAARAKARQWLEWIERGVDPAEQIERERREQERKRKTTFAAVVDDYLAREIDGHDPKRPLKRSAARMRNVLTNILVPLFGQRPIADLTADDILPPFQLIARMGSDRALLKLGVRKTLSRHGRKAQPSPEQARALFTFAKMIFNWALDQRGYGLEHSPLDRVSKVRRLGASVRRDRTLSDEELAALVLAIERLPVPYRQAYQALLHSGLRLNEAAGARWSEIPPDSDVWVIAAERMKGKNSGTGQARPHAVPLTEPLRRIFASMPRGEHGDCIFSHEDGARPIVIGSTRLKRKLDAEMLAMLRQRAAARGENADRVTLSPWRNHDIRRTCRSTLSRLRVADDVAEAILAHQRPGVTGTYDRWHRLPEKRAALERWSRFLAELVRPHSVEARTGTASSVG